MSHGYLWDHSTTTNCSSPLCYIHFHVRSNLPFRGLMVHPKEVGRWIMPLVHVSTMGTSSPAASFAGVMSYVANTFAAVSQTFVLPNARPGHTRRPKPNDTSGNGASPDLQASAGYVPPSAVEMK